MATSAEKASLQVNRSSDFGPAPKHASRSLREGVTMSSSDDSGCRGALQPGLLVKDRLGARKRITRVEDDTVYWEYISQPPPGAPRESSTSYDDFVDSHFVLPQPGSSRGAA